MSSELATAPVNPGFHKATSQLATVLGIEPRMMVETLKKQCFPSMNADSVSDAQLAAFISVANTMELNPLIPGMLYAYPGKNGGIIPVTGPDGVLKKLDEEITKEKIDGYECSVFPEDVTLPPTHAVATIFRKNHDHPAKFTAIFKEWAVGSNPNWASRPRHMIWLRAIKQCARQVIHGVPFDEDDVVIGDMVNVTPKERIERPDPPVRAKKGAAAVQENATKTEPKNDATMEAEIVPQKPAATAQEAPPPAKETVAAPAPDDEAKAHQIAADIAAEKKAEAAKKSAPTTKAVRDSLEDKEEIVVACKLKKVFAYSIAMAGTPTPSVQADVTGDFNGEVFDIGGGKIEKDEIVPSSLLWKVGETVKLTLRGRANKKTGKVMAIAMKIEVAEGAPESLTLAVE